MAAKIRSELYLVLLVALILITYKLYQRRHSAKNGIKSHLKPSHAVSSIFTSLKYKHNKSGGNISTFNHQRTSQAGTEKAQVVKPKVKKLSKPIIKKFNQIWKRKGTIFYREIVPNGIPKLDVLLLHGHSFTSAIWVNLTTMDLLASAGFRVIAMDLPGYGKSNYHMTDKTQKGLQKFLGKFLTKANVVSPVIVSPSASGIYSLSFITHKKVSGFVSIAVVATDRFAQKDFKSFTAPTLIIRGSRDNSLGKRSMETLHQAIPHSTTKIIEGAGHACYVDKPNVFHEILLAFLNGINAKRVKNGTN